MIFLQTGSAGCARQMLNTLSVKLVHILYQTLLTLVITQSLLLFSVSMAFTENFGHRVLLFCPHPILLRLFSD